MRGSLSHFAILFAALVSVPLHAEPVVENTRYEISHTYETKSEGSSSSSSSRGGFLYVENVRLLQDGCSDRVFDSVDDPSVQRPLAEWKLPVRIRDCGREDRTILNRDEMVSRLETFLEAIEATREACGSHYFTWNVFQIDCEPEAALELLNQFDLGSVNLAHGAVYELADGSGVGTLELTGADDDGTETFAARGIVDPGHLRDIAASTLVVAAEISGQTLTKEQAIESLASSTYSGEFTVTFQKRRDSSLITRTMRHQSRVEDANGQVDLRWSEQITERKRVEPVSESDPLT